MSNRLKNPQLPSMDATHCENFFNKLVKKEKRMPYQPTRNSRPSSTSVIRKKGMLPNTRQQNQNLASKVKSNSMAQSNAEILKAPAQHRETFSENSNFMDALRAKKKQKTRSNSVSRQPWDNILKSNKPREDSLFNNFDPLRTLHFLAKELKNKLQSTLPDDSNVIQMVNDMQLALKRVPPEVASRVHLHKPPAPAKSKSGSRVLSDEEPEKLIQVIKACTIEKPSQTVDFTQGATETIQKMMEESTSKLERSCRQMEMLCGRLKSEKDELELQLKNEKQNVLFLKKRIDSLEEENEEIVSSRMKELEEENESLRTLVQSLKTAVDDGSKTSTELNSQLIELKNQKNKVVEECMSLKHDLSVSKLEREKYLALLAIRDQQICEIKIEMDQLQQVINDQLKELNSSNISNLPSVDSMIGTNYDNWEEGYKTSADHYDTIKKSNFKELNPSVDSICVEEILDHGYPFGFSNKNDALMRKQASLRDMFSEMKKQTYSVTDFDQTKEHKS